MISIFQTARSLGPAVSKSTSRTVHRITEALRLNLIQARGLNHKELAADLLSLAAAVDNPQGEAPVAEVTGRVCEGVERYFGDLSKSIDSLGFDLALSIRSLATLLHSNSGDQEEFLTRMEKIRDRVQSGHSLDDVERLRQHLENCLTSLRAELFEARRLQAEQQSSMNEHLANLQRSISALRSKVPPKRTNGPALCIVRVRRLKVIRDRYGEEIAQKMRDFVIQLLLVRWPAAYDITPHGEECLVVIDSENLDLDFHRSALRKLSGEKNTFSMKVQGRELLLPLAIDWTVVRAPAEGDLEEFIHNFLEGMAQKDTQAASLDQALGLR
jgi:hypothetical protein